MLPTSSRNQLRKLKQRTFSPWLNVWLLFHTVGPYMSWIKKNLLEIFDLVVFKSTIFLFLGCFVLPVTELGGETRYSQMRNPKGCFETSMLGSKGDREKPHFQSQPLREFKQCTPVYKCNVCFSH